ncbi:hypothetical protein SAY87_002844 [Trapa incisa]|uniref:Uncharacterized protein n=1 Tax=Trapa incisa TaxID=236973 RepID=A0AAN7QI50_9MYRT|nr:hypothetical protein SAY87_002844 [Trapa incisa]
MGLEDSWQKVRFSLRNLCICGTKRFGSRRNGLMNLQPDVSRCKKGDVYIMWEMLNRTEMDAGRKKKRNRSLWKWKLSHWTRLPPSNYCH